MRWPLFISTYCHESIVNALTSQVSDLRREREILLDRLGTIGLGGPLFTLPQLSDSSPNTEPEAELTEEQTTIQRVLALRRRPSKFAAAVTRQAYTDYNKAKVGPTVKWVADGQPEVSEMLDKAEQAGISMGRKQA